MFETAKDQIPKIMEMFDIDPKDNVAKTIMLVGWLLWHELHLYHR